MQLPKTKRMITASAVCVIASACASAPQTSLAPSPQEAAIADNPTGSTISIEVRQNDRLALFLFAWHAARSLSERDLPERVALSKADADALVAHADAFAPLRAALEPYLGKHHLRDQEMLFMSGYLAGAEVELLDSDLIEALLAFESTYLEHFAPRHRAATRTMAGALELQLDKHGDAMARAVARAVEGVWRADEPILLDLIPYVSRAGAYTISFHTVMSSMRADYRNHALEMAFHEAAHTSPMSDRIKQVAQDALARHGVENRRFWHYLQFYAIGRATQSVLGDDYVPYHVANGLDQRGSAKRFYAAIDAVWDDHDTLAERADAAIALIAAG